MRIIKFRFWNDRAKEMCIPDHIANDLDAEKYQMMQFTGLFDRRGKEIYEGDIVKQCDDYIGIVKFGDYTDIFIGWADVPGMTGWIIESLNKNKYGDLPLWNKYNDDDTEVIGNIHKNKELLEI